MNPRKMKIPVPRSTGTPTGSERKPAVFIPQESFDLDLITAAPKPREVDKSITLINQEEKASSVFLIRRGLVKLRAISPGGGELILGLRASGWYAGGASVISQTSSIYSVITLTPCTVSEIPAHLFRSALMDSAKLSRHFLDTVCNELTSIAAAQTHLMSSSPEERLMQFLRERSPDLRRQVLDPLPALKQIELAMLLGMTPEHLSRLFRRIAKQSQISHL